jgi:hypothetical protein
MERAGSAELAPSSAWPRPSRHSPSRRQGDRHAGAQSVGLLVARSGPAVSTLIRKVPGLRCYRPGRFVLGEAAMTNAGALAETRHFISPHVFATVMARTGRLRSALRPMAPSMRSTRITRKTLEPRLARGRGRAESRRRDGGHVRRLTSPRGGVRKAAASTPNFVRALNLAPARHYPACLYAARSSSAWIPSQNA